MKILIVTLNYAPELVGIGKYNGEMAEWLSRNGHEVRVIAAPPYYPEWLVSQGYKTYKYKHEKINGVKVWRCPLYVPLKPSGLKRILHLLSFAFSSIPIFLLQLFWRPNIVITVEPPFFSAPIVWLMSRLFGAKCWLHIQDFEIDAAFELGILKSKRLRSLLMSIESWILCKFDVVSTISDQMIKKLNHKNVSLCKQIYFPNWVDVDQIFPIQRGSFFRKELNIEVSRVVALYSGNMGEKQGLEILIEAAKALRENDNILFVMCGAGAALSRLQRLAEGLTNVLWLPLQPIEKLNELLNLADIHLLPQRSDAADLVMPSKLTGMLASGKPVLATVDRGTQVATVLEKAGVIVPPDDVSGFISALINLSVNEKLRAELGEKARSYAIENLSIEVILGRLNDDLNEVSKV